MTDHDGIDGKNQFRKQLFLKTKDAHKNIVKRFQRQYFTEKVLEEERAKQEFQHLSKHYVEYTELLDRVRNFKSQNWGLSKPEEYTPKSSPMLEHRIEELKKQYEIQEQQKKEEMKKAWIASGAAKRAKMRLKDYQMKLEKYPQVPKQEVRAIPRKPRPPHFPRKKVKKVSKHDDEFVSLAVQENIRPHSAKKYPLLFKKPQVHKHVVKKTNKKQQPQQEKKKPHQEKKKSQHVIPSVAVEPKKKASRKAKATKKVEPVLSENQTDDGDALPQVDNYQDEISNLLSELNQDEEENQEPTEDIEETNEVEEIGEEEEKIEPTMTKEEVLSTVDELLQKLLENPPSATRGYLSTPHQMDQATVLLQPIGVQ